MHGCPHAAECKKLMADMVQQAGALGWTATELQAAATNALKPNVPLDMPTATEDKLMVSMQLIVHCGLAR